MADTSDVGAAAAQMEFSQLFYTAKHHHVEALQSLETRMAKQFSAYNADSTKLKQERDAAVAARVEAETTMQEVTQKHLVDRHKWEKEVQKLQDDHRHTKELAELHRTDAERSKIHAERALNERNELQAQLTALTEKLESIEATLVKYTVMVGLTLILLPYSSQYHWQKWSFELAVSQGWADRVHRSEPSVTVDVDEVEFIGGAWAGRRASTLPPHRRRAKTARRRSNKRKPFRRRAAVEGRRVRRLWDQHRAARTVTAMFDMPIKEEEEESDHHHPRTAAAATAPLKRKRQTTPASTLQQQQQQQQQQRTPRPTNEPTTPQHSAGSSHSQSHERKKQRKEQRAADGGGEGEISEDEMMLQSTSTTSPGQTRRARPSTTSRHGQTQLRKVSGGQPSRGQLSARRVIESDDDDEEDDDDTDLPSRSTSPKRRKTGGTPFPRRRLLEDESPCDLAIGLCRTNVVSVMSLYPHPL
ncbi:hypothetical protein BKA62DRAFT_822535 [Auriculariales sp. MPI-PUGE-AT-0066]|nr:hypothetical protein BKA62DRAFT_822535 [Auriculariales sp. MPI-PUGE-AT-0066]